MRVNIPFLTKEKTAVVHICYISVCELNKNLNRTLAIE